MEPHRGVGGLEHELERGKGLRENKIEIDISREGGREGGREGVEDGER